MKELLSWIDSLEITVGEFQRLIDDVLVKNTPGSRRMLLNFRIDSQRLWDARPNKIIDGRSNIVAKEINQ